MIKLKCILLCIFACFSSFSWTQSDSSSFSLFPSESKQIGIVAGIHQNRSTFFELGLSYSHETNNGCLGGYYTGNSASFAYNPFQKLGQITITRWASFLIIFVMGYDLHSFTDFKQYNLGFKPFIGIGNGPLSLTYGYNFEVINHRFPGMIRHCFSLRWNLPLVQLK